MFYNRPIQKTLPCQYYPFNQMPKVTFNNQNPVFFQSLKEAADHYFSQKGIERTGDIRLYVKTVILFLVAFTLYFYTLFFWLPVWIYISLYRI